MTRLAIIGGTGLTRLETVTITSRDHHSTPYGAPSGPVITGTLAGHEILFLPRHGDPHAIPPHKINYRANLRALKDSGVTSIIAINAVGGITSAMGPCVVAVPDQIIDYTWSREHTYSDGTTNKVEHVDFTEPYSAPLRKLINDAATYIRLDVQARGTYGATEGPRLESAAEIARMERDGCDLVGMTGMPEAALARELGIDYACISLVVNWAAGKSSDEITMEIIQQNLDSGMDKIKRLLEAVVKLAQ